MDTETIAVEARVEATHWWFVQRRRLFASEINRLALSRNLSVLDIGTGTGANLRLLKTLGFSDVTGVDPNPEVIRFCAEKGLGNVVPGDASAVPFENASFDFVMATDVIEHVDDDNLALREIVRVLKPGGTLLLTVPTFNELWGLQDDRSHHKRRYRLNALVEQVKAVSLDIRRRYYFNYLLFVPIWLARQIIRFASVKLSSENEVNTPIINSLLNLIFRLDVATAPILHPPFGVSALIVAQKPAAS